MVPGMTRTECTGTESVPTTLTYNANAQIERRRLPTLNLGVVNSPKPYFPSPTIIVHNDHPARRIATLTNGHHHPWSSPTTLNDHCRTQMQQRHTYATMLADTSHSKRAPTRTTSTTTIVHNDRPSSPHRHSHQRPPPSTVFTHHPQ